MKQDKEARLDKLATLLATGCYNWEDIKQILPEYQDLVRRSIERDMATLANRGYVLIAERIHGSRWVSHRLEGAPSRTVAKPEKAQYQPIEPKPDIETIEDAKLFNIVEAGSWLGVSPRRVRIFCQEERLKAQKAGNRYVFTGKDLKEFARLKRIGGPKKEQ